jgi:hypothetical protein
MVLTYAFEFLRSQGVASWLNRFVGVLKCWMLKVDCVILWVKLRRRRSNFWTLSSSVPAPQTTLGSSVAAHSVQALLLGLF